MLSKDANNFLTYLQHSEDSFVAELKHKKDNAILKLDYNLARILRMLPNQLLTMKAQHFLNQYQNLFDQALLDPQLADPQLPHQLPDPPNQIAFQNTTEMLSKMKVSNQKDDKYASPPKNYEKKRIIIKKK